MRVMFLKPTRTKVFDSLAKSSGVSSHLSLLRLEGVVPSKTAFNSESGTNAVGKCILRAKYRNSQLNVGDLALSLLQIYVCVLSMGK